MAYFPMFVNLTDSICLVVGGGNVAYRKIKVLLDFTLTADEFPTDKEFQMEIDHDGAK